MPASPPDPSALAAVRVLLDAAGVSPDEREVEALARAYPGLRRQIEGLYAVPTGDDAPAPVFRADFPAELSR